MYIGIRMSTPANHAKRSKALRKRIGRVSRHAFSAKQLGWRITAGWIWIYALGLVFGQGGRLKGWENCLLLAVDGTLVRSGFAPTSPEVFAICIKMFWLFAICAFSWVQILGFGAYVLFFPLIPLTRVVLRGRLDPHRKIREEAFKKARREGHPIPKRGWGFPLLSLLLIWLALYGRTSAPRPLEVWMFLLGLYFFYRVAKAFSFATPVDTPRWERVEAMLASARKFGLNTIDNAKAGKITGARSLSIVIWTSMFFLRAFRIASSTTVL